MQLTKRQEEALELLKRGYWLYDMAGIGVWLTRPDRRAGGTHKFGQAARIPIDRRTLTALLEKGLIIEAVRGTRIVKYKLRE